MSLLKEIEDYIYDLNGLSIDEEYGYNKYNTFSSRSNLQHSNILDNISCIDSLMEREYEFFENSSMKEYDICSRLSLKGFNSPINAIEMYSFRLYDKDIECRNYSSWKREMKVYKKI